MAELANMNSSFGLLQGQGEAARTSESETSVVEPEHSLHEAAKNGEREEVLKILQRRAGALNDFDEEGWTALHYAADNNHLGVIETLLLNGADPDAVTVKKGNTALHLAAIKGHDKAVLSLLDPNKQLQQCGPENSGQLKPANVDSENSDKQTPLHYASAEGHVGTVRVLLEYGAAVNQADKDFMQSPLHYASGRGHVETVKVLLEHGAAVTATNYKERTAMHYACLLGNAEVLKMLLAQDTAAANLKMVDGKGNTPLMLAIQEGQENIVKAIVMKFDHVTIRNLFQVPVKSDGFKEYTTPMREAIRRIPDTAVMVLDCCIEPSNFPRDSKEYSIEFDYSLLEDYQDREAFLEDGDFVPTWRPVGFDRNNHPLNLMVQSENTKLLTHPLVTSLLIRKWKVTRVVSLIALLFHCIFLAFLTAFALTAPNPLSETCSAVFSGTLGNASSVDNCARELGDSRQRSTLTTAVFVVIFALTRLIIEAYGMYQHKVLYFTDGVNWMKLLMAVFAIIFAWVFNTDCLCAYQWQWQIGTVAVFLAWLDLIIFAQHLPVVGIYVTMLRDILWRFIKTIPLAFMLVIAFGIGFFMLFSEPGILRSPFSTPARALLSVVAYSAGSFPYTSVFSLAPGGTAEDSGEITYPPVSYILFIIFVIIMTILLNNLLTALAVGDTEKILQNTEARNIALKIQLILSVEATLPTKLRRKFIVDKETLYPNMELPLLQKLDKLLRKLQLRTSPPKGIEISKVLKQDDTLPLTVEVQEIKTSQDELKKSQEEIKKSQEEIKQMMQEILQKLQ